MHLIFNTLLDQNAIQELEKKNSHEVLAMRGEKIAEVLCLTKVKADRAGTVRYETQWGQKSPEGLYLTLLNLILQTNEIGQDVNYGIYNSYAEEWWKADGANIPVLFNNYMSAVDYLKQEKSKMEIDGAEGIVKIYRDSLENLIDMPRVTYSMPTHSQKSFDEEQEALDDLRLAHLKVAVKILATGHVNNMTTEIDGVHYYLFAVNDKYELRCNAEQNRNASITEYETIETIHGLGVQELNAIKDKMNEWLKKPSFL